MLPPLAPRNMSGATWAAREENGVGVSSMWIDGQDLAARLEHQAQRSYCVWLKPHQSDSRGSSWSGGKLHRLPPWHATLAIRVCRELPLMMMTTKSFQSWLCVVLRFFNLNLVVG